MQIFTLNFQGIRPECKHTKHKIPALNEEINSSSLFIPFFAITETHLSSDHFDAEVQINNYEIYRADRKDKRQGGVAIYIHNSITANTVEKYSDGNCEAVMIYIKKANLNISAIYRPPNAPEKSFKECINKVKAFTENYPGSEHTMLGDFNFRYIDWKSETISTDGIPASETAQAKYFIDYTNNNLLMQMVQEETRQQSIIDLILTTNEDMIHNIVTEKTKMSDHNIVRCNIIHTGLQRGERETKTFQEKKPLDKLDFNTANWEAINKDLEKLDWERILDKSKTIDELYNTFEEHVTSACSNNCRQRRRMSNKAMYIPKDRRAMIRRKKKLNGKINYYKYIDKDNTDEKLEKVEKKKEEVEKAIKESIRQEIEKKEMEVINKIKLNPKAFFAYTKKSCKTSSRVGPLIDKDQKIQDDSKVKANILQDQYCSAFSNPENVSADNKPTSEKLKMNISDIDFSTENIKKAIDEIPNNAAPGPDKLPAMILKKCKDQLALPLYIIWRLSLDTGKIPEILKSQGIIPIFKKGDRSKASNYRPVSLTSHIIKLFERILRIKIVDYLENNNLLSNDQHGFRQNRSTVTQLLAHVDNILTILESSEDADVVYLDFAKAFDKVDHRILLQKVENLGITGKLLEWIKNFLSDRKQHVIVDGEVSDSAPVTSGVPQGTVMGPVLFIIFIDDLTEAIQYADLLKFADDSKMTLKVKNLQDHHNLQQDLHSSIIWALLNNMQLNTEKFQLLQHGKNQQIKLPYETSNDIKVSGSESVTDLGIIITKDLSWDEQITNMVNGGKRFTSWILRCFQSRKPEVIMILFKLFVIPRLEYACPVWSPYKIKDITRIEALQRTITSKLENLQHQNYHERLQTLGLYSLQRRRERYIIITVWKMAVGLTKNFLNLEFYNTRRFGVKCRVKLSKAMGHIKTVRNNYFTATGPSLFNCVPKDVKANKKLANFKSDLDKFLQNIPDTPPLPGYICQNTNSIRDWCAQGCTTQNKGGADCPDES